MDEHIRRAEQVVEAARRLLTSEGLPFFTGLAPYENGCMVHVDFFDEEAGEDGDGLTFTLNARHTSIEVLDPHDYHMQEPELLEYLVMRARGATPQQAFAAIYDARPKWWQRLTSPGRTRTASTATPSASATTNRSRCACSPSSA